MVARDKEDSVLAFMFGYGLSDEKSCCHRTRLRWNILSTYRQPDGDNAIQEERWNQSKQGMSSDKSSERRRMLTLPPSRHCLLNYVGRWRLACSKVAAVSPMIPETICNSRNGESWAEKPILNLPLRPFAPPSRVSLLRSACAYSSPLPISRVRLCDLHLWCP
jgi:hypothetical protein